MDTIKKETVVDILKWGEEQNHIRGDIDLIIQTVMSYEEEE